VAKLARGDEEYLSRELIRRYDLYLSFTGGPTLARLERDWGARRARPLYCSVDPTLYSPEPAGAEPLWSMGYLGTYSDDRQPTLDALLLDTARRLPDEKFIVAGPDYPDTDRWPANVEHTSHLPPSEHRAFYNQQRWTLNVTRRDMIRAGYAPSVRLFEAAACGTPL
jgi:spore maturation protein CgeB